jgi:hypothetical protein
MNTTNERISLRYCCATRRARKYQKRENFLVKNKWVEGDDDLAAAVISSDVLVPVDWVLLAWIKRFEELSYATANEVFLNASWELVKQRMTY